MKVLKGGVVVSEKNMISAWILTFVDQKLEHAFSETPSAKANAIFARHFMTMVSFLIGFFFFGFPIGVFFFLRMWSCVENWHVQNHLDRHWNDRDLHKFGCE